MENVMTFVFEHTNYLHLLSELDGEFTFES
jgi:hypothetical protein